MLAIVQKLRSALDECDGRSRQEVQAIASNISKLFPIYVHLVKTKQERDIMLEDARTEMVQCVNETIDNLKRFTSLKDGENWGDLVQQTVEVMVAKINASASMEKYNEKKEDCSKALDDLENRLEKED